MRYRVWIHDSSGTHTPSHPLGSRRAAEVFAANRSRFRRDCNVLVCEYGSREKPVTSYRGGQLIEWSLPNSFNPERVEVRTEGAKIFMLTQKASSL